MKLILIFIIFLNCSYGFGQIQEFKDYPNYRVSDVAEISDHEIVVALGPMITPQISSYYDFLKIDMALDEKTSFLQLPSSSNTLAINIFIDSDMINIIGVKGEDQYVIFKYVYSADLELISYEETESFSFPDPIDFFKIKQIDDVY
jgi:hypothetical protein